MIKDFSTLNKLKSMFISHFQNVLVARVSTLDFQSKMYVLDCSTGLCSIFSVEKAKEVSSRKHDKGRSILKAMQLS